MSITILRRGGLAALLAATVLAGAGCKDEGIETLEKIKAKACACKDAACLEEVQKDLTAAAEKKTRDMDKATKIAGEIAECMVKVSTAAPAAAPAGGEAKPTEPAPAGDKPADPAAAPAGEAKPADPAAAPAPAGDKPAEPAPAGDKPAEPAPAK